MSKLVVTRALRASLQDIQNAMDADGCNGRKGLRAAMEDPAIRQAITDHAVARMARGWPLLRADNNEGKGRK